MNKHSWIKEFNAAITVSDKDGILLEMNDKSAKTYEQDGGLALLGTNMYDCHPEPSRSKLKVLMDEKKENIYTIEKNGKKKLIFQSPWIENGEYKGIVEMAIEIPEVMPHFVRG